MGPAWWNATHTLPETLAGPIYPFETTFHALFIPSPYPPSDSHNTPYGPNYSPRGPFTAISPPYGSLLKPFKWDPYYVVPHAYYSMPVIGSAGPNKSFGLLPASAGTPDPMAPDGVTDDANDNIYSYRLRLGARGD
jgi:hypothetical protein